MWFLSRPKHNKFAVPEELIKELKGWHEYLGIPTVEVQNMTGSKRKNDSRQTAKVSKPNIHYLDISEELYDVFYAYDEVISDLAAKLPSGWHSVYARFPRRALRIAALLSSMDCFALGKKLSDNKWPTQMKHWHRAVVIVEQWRESHHQIIEHIRDIDPTPPSAQARIEQSILKKLRKGPCTIRDLVRNSGKGYEEIRKALETLVKVHEVKRDSINKTDKYELI